MFNPLRRSLRELWTAQEGNVAIIFSIALIPVVALAGGAIDYSRASAKRTAIQAALDATALAMSKNAVNLSPSDLKTQAAAYFAAAYGKPDASSITIDTTYSNTGGSQLTVTGTATVDTNFLGIIGINSITVGSSATTAWGLSRLRVALALDNTGSMQSAGKLNALKTATNNLLTQLQNAATTNGDVYVSIVPFSRGVNFDASNYNATWVGWTDWDSEPPILVNNKPTNWSQTGPGDDCPFSSYSHGFTCTSGPANGSSTTSNIPSSGSYAGYICPSIDSGRRDSTKIGVYYNGCYNSVPTTTTSTRVVGTGWWASCNGYSNCSCTGSGSQKVCTQTTTTTGAPYTHTWIPNNHSTWNGCITDRGSAAAPGTAAGNDQTATAPTAGDATTLYPARQDSYCPAEVSGLSYNWSAMHSLVNGLVATGSTNQPIGLVTAWHSLVGIGPFTAPALDPNYAYNQVIILLSDGLNTQDRWYGNGSDTNTSVDYRMYDSAGRGTCANIKAAGVTIYTIQVNTESDPVSTLLSNCASDPSKFFYLTSSNQIADVFNTIGTNLAKLRIAK
jgi:Flp pilus assembly protein TadG